jgi:hypothetical protein
MDFTRGQLVEHIRQPGRVGIIVKVGKVSDVMSIHISQLIAARGGTQAATEAGSEQPAVQQLNDAIALLNRWICIYGPLEPDSKVRADTVNFLAGVAQQHH